MIQPFNIKSLASNKPHESRSIKSVEFLSGLNKIIWKQSPEELIIQAKGNKPCEAAYTFRIKYLKFK